MALPNVCFIRQELSQVLDLYYLIRDCIAGEPTIKAARTRYLPMPNPDDTSKENLARYRAYLTRAVFYNVTRRTLAGLVGQVFSRKPTVKVPSPLEAVLKDANGEAIPLDQQAERACQYVTAYSRAGLFVDYPEVPEGGVTVAELETGKIRPTITVLSPLQIINWRTETEGADTFYTLVVIVEAWPMLDDGFEMKLAAQLRVLKLVNGSYVQEIWRERQPTAYDPSANKKLKGNFEIFKTINVKGHDGQPLKEIPFMFLGSENNDSHVDNPNMYDIAALNIAHYRNSADYEEACFIVGQPTPVLTGLTQDWVDTVLKGKVAFGSRGGIPLPVGGEAQLLQAEENTMLKEAMETKERQMVALGAKLVQQKEVQRTATESQLEAASESSVLSTIAKNVSAGYQWALEWCAVFMGLSEGGIEYKLNDDFDMSAVAPEQTQGVVKNWQAGALTFGEMRTVLRRAGQATEDDEKAKEEIKTDTEAAMTFEAETQAAAKGQPPAN